MCTYSSRNLDPYPCTGFIFLIFYSILFLYLIRVSETTNDDEKWTEVHGNVPLTSGEWDYLWSISKDENKLKNISFQAHQRCFNVIPNITWANASIKELFFPDNKKFQPIKLDVLMYTVEGRHHDNAPDKPYHFHLTKGLRPDCVYFVLPFNDDIFKELKLTSDHICDIKMPSPQLTHHFLVYVKRAIAYVRIIKNWECAIEIMCAYSPRTLGSISLIFYSIVFLYLIRVSETTDDDEKWTEVHGNDPLKSGDWDYLWNISKYEVKLKNISFQAHRRCFNVIPNITWANASTKQLSFPDNYNFQPIKLDVLMYTVKGRYHHQAPDKPFHFHLTKGLRPDCVYFVMPFEVNNTKELVLTPDHICDIKMPSP